MTLLFKHPPRTEACRCKACGNDEPMGCGNICPDCSWEDHLSSIAHADEDYDTPRDDTPACCLATHEAQKDFYGRDES